MNYNYLKDFWPTVRKLSMKSDYCSTCFLKQSMLRSAESPEEKNEIQENLDKHLEKSQDAREFYNLNKNRAKLDSELISEQSKLMLSFDWAQNWELEKYLKQFGDFYFMHKQKVGLFGITNEATDLQSFYLFPECELECYEKGPNIIYSCYGINYYNFQSNLRNSFCMLTIAWGKTSIITCSGSFIG